MLPTYVARERERELVHRSSFIAEVLVHRRTSEVGGGT